MVNALYAFIWLAALWKWGDWKNWRKYYPTILFFMIGDFIYLYLLSEHYPMWRYIPHALDKSSGITNAHVSLSIMLIKYPATVLIYLSKFPERGKLNQVLYVFGWVILYAVNEFIDTRLDLIHYYNGWTYWWSFLFNIVMFFILRVHFRNPILAWVYSIAFIVFLWQMFDVPYSVFH